MDKPIDFFKGKKFIQIYHSAATDAANTTIANADADADAEVDAPDNAAEAADTDAANAVDVDFFLLKTFSEFFFSFPFQIFL